jgi:cysteine-rich repeat protein
VLGLALASCLSWSQLENGVCGDGFVGREEACDDGNRISGDGCSDSCHIEPAVCGNGRRDPGEDCDDANSLDNDDCVDCRSAVCGDGHRQDAEEECDDGNDVSGDGCFECKRESVMAGSSCGDGQLNTDEACDDGNKSDTDSCLTGCSWATCGDGRVRSGVEECDDGNITAGDGCTRGCLLCGDHEGSFFRAGNAHCYSLHNEAVSEQQARSTCQNEGGDLWTVTSEAEGLDVTSKLSLSGSYWLGLLTSNGTNSWVSGEGTKYTAFAAGQPNPAFRCVTLQVAGTGSAWSSEACPNKLGFVCERAPAFQYPADHHAYKLHTAALDAPAARATCIAEGGHLAALETDAERLFVGKNVGITAWVDATDAAAEGRFIWPSGEPVDRATFAAGQPDDKDATQNCLLLNVGDKYADAACSEPHAFICELD